MILSVRNTVFVIGHKHPDTDSIASAIGYAFLKKSLGLPAVAARLGCVNKETQYLLNRFHFELPYELKDARVMLKEVDMDCACVVTEKTTIFNALKMMEKCNHHILGVVNEKEQLLGIVTKSDFSRVGLDDTAKGIDLLKKTPISLMNQTLDGKLIYEAEKSHINGKVSIIALSKNHVQNYEIKDRIVIVGNDVLAQLELIQKGAGLLIIVWSETIDVSVIAKAKEYQCSLILSGHGCMNTSRYLYFSIPVALVMTKNITYFREDELACDVKNKLIQSRYRSYPVLDSNRKLVGFIGRYHIMNYKNKNVILVDHNEFSQSVKGIESAEILEVIDHHRIHDFSTNCPVSFRNEIVGSTSTIVASMFKENQIPIPADLAGLLLGAVLSDTLKFQSPTTTQKDKEIAHFLAAFAELDMDAFATDMFTVTSDLSGKSFYELISVDYKLYDIQNRNILVSQVIIPCVDYLYEEESEIEEAMRRLMRENQAETCVVAFTSILENGSVFYSSGNKKDWIFDIFPNKDGEKHSLQKGILSRKNQIIPMLSKHIA